MIEALLIVLVVGVCILVALVIFLLLLLRKQRPESLQDFIRNLVTSSDKTQDESLRGQCKDIREEVSSSLTVTRAELSAGLDRMRSTASENQVQFQKGVQDRLDVFSQSLNQNTDRIAGVLQENRVELVKTLQERLEALQKTTSDSTEKQVTTMTEMKDKVSSSVADGLKEIQEKNEQKLEQMRLTVDEKLQKTLDERLTQSFEVVSKQLIEVQKGLTEMQTLAQDVGGLKRALTNVKVRGMLGESQLGALLEQFLTRDQYEENVAVKPRSSERVEFAIRLPGGEDGGPLWLPIDSKLPLDAYQRLQDTYENGEKAAWAQAGKAFESQLYTQAAAISSKYIDVPHTTDFALMYLPFEGLYAEAIRRPGVFQDIQKTHRVTIVGPTTLAAFVYSLQVGFKTLAISKQSSEVWRLLGAIKTEFGKFGDAVSSVQKNLETASSNLSKVSTRARQMEKRLDGVQALPQEEALKLLPVGSEKFGNGEDQA
jgi:DNA recombination protein RmuC